MPGLVPGIYVFLKIRDNKTWMAGTKPGHDGGEISPHVIASEAKQSTFETEKTGLLRRKRCSQ